MKERLSDKESAESVSSQYHQQERQNVVLKAVDLCERLNGRIEHPPPRNYEITSYWTDYWGLCQNNQIWAFCLETYNSLNPDGASDIAIVKEMCPGLTECRTFWIADPTLQPPLYYRRVAHCVELSVIYITNPADSESCTARQQYVLGVEAPINHHATSPRELVLSGQATSPRTLEQVTVRDLYFEISTTESGIMHRLHGEMWKGGLTTAIYMMTTSTLYVRFCVDVNPLRPGSTFYPIIRLLGGGIFLSELHRPDDNESQALTRRQTSQDS